MQSFPKLLLSCLFCIVATTGFSQQPMAHTLLWRISGKNLQQPSYLFGTMHLTDKRLFRFDDSVYRAIEKTAGLAIEVNPDEMAAYAINKEFDELQTSKRLKDILNKKDFDKYSNALSKKMHKPATQITASDIVKEKNKWMRDYLEKGEMPTFVDAYLYNIARKQGKWVGGIEDMSDQAGLFEDLIDQSDITNILANDQSGSSVNTMLEKMIALYQQQNIEGIEAMTSESASSGQKDLLLIRRNIKMARRIDSLTALRSMFCAVGAAHLPGDSGVIQLLRQRGFTVEPVLSKTRIDAQDYHFKEVHIPWVTVTDANNLYTVSMPGNPAPVKLFGVIEMKFFFDLFNLSAFYTMAVVRPDNGNISTDSMFNQLAHDIFKGEKNVVSKNITKHSIPGKEYTQTLNNAILRLQLFINNKTLYMAGAYSLKKNQQSDDAANFFESFTINTASSPRNNFYAFTDSVMGISLVSPAPLGFNKDISKENASGWKLSAYAATDIANGVYVMLFSKDIRAGGYLANDSLIYKDLYNRFAGQYKHVQWGEKAMDHAKAVEFKGESTAQHGLYLKALNAVRNNRNVLLMAICDSAHMQLPVVDTLFSSFRFIEQPAMHWQYSTAPDGSCSAWLPSPMRTYETSSSQEHQVIAYDTTTATTYFMIPDTLQKYSWYSSDSSFWQSIQQNNIGENKLLEARDVANGSLTGRELLLKAHDAGNVYYRMRLLLQGDKLYKLFVAGEKEFLYNDNNNRFFTSFRISSNDTSHFITQSKSALLLADLQSRDQDTRYAANKALGNAPFEEKDIPALYKALQQVYLSPYDSLPGSFINYRLAQQVANVNSPTIPGFVREQYPVMRSEHPEQAAALLALLAYTHTQESYNTLFTLLQQAPPKEAPAYSFEYNLTDSLALLSNQRHALLQLAGDSVLGSLATQALVTLVDSGYLSLDTVKLYENNFLACAGKHLPALKDSSYKNEDYNLYSVLKLLGRFKTPAAYQMLRSYLSVADKDLKETAALALIADNQPVSQQVLGSLAADARRRSSLYQKLEKLQKTALFPQQYRTQTYFAEAAIQDALYDDDADEAVEIKLVQKKQASYKGRQYLFYLFRVTTGSGKDADVRLGIAGGYHLNGTSLQPVKDITGIYEEAKYSLQSINTQFQDYLKTRAKEED